MTTVAYKDGVIASDTLVTNRNGIRCGFAGKIAKGKTTLGGAAGVLADVHLFLGWVRKDCAGKCPKFEHPFNGILIIKDSQFYVDKEGAPYVIDAPYMAVGSGEEVAMGAMCVGADAEDALHAAMKLDTNSGGKIETLKLAPLQVVH